MLASQRVERVTFHVKGKKTLALETDCDAENVNHFLDVGTNLADLKKSENVPLSIQNLNKSGF